MDRQRLCDRRVGRPREFRRRVRAVFVAAREEDGDLLAAARKRGSLPCIWRGFDRPVVGVFRGERGEEVRVFPRDGLGGEPGANERKAAVSALVEDAPVVHEAPQEALKLEGLAELARVAAVDVVLVRTGVLDDRGHAACVESHHWVLGYPKNSSKFSAAVRLTLVSHDSWTVGPRSPRSRRVDDDWREKTQKFVPMHSR